MDITFSYGLTLIAGFILALVFTPLSRALAVATGFIDYPKQNRAHRTPTPLLGGVSVAAAAGLAFTLLAPRMPLVGELWRQGLLPRLSVPVILLLASMGLIMGLVDDRFGIKPRLKLLGQSLIAAVFLATVIPFEWSPWLLLWPLGMLWMVGLTNAFNLLDSLDGILGGIGTITGLFLGGLALKMGRPDLGILALAGAGGSLGFLCFNFPPATIFLGDAGAFFIGLLMAGVGWELGGAQFLTFGSAAPAVVLVLAYPIFDITFVTVTRIWERRPVSVGGVDHTTHRLHTIFGKGRRTQWTVYGLNALSGFAGLIALESPPMVAWTLLAVVVFFYVSLGVILARVPVRPKRLLTAFLARETEAQREVA